MLSGTIGGMRSCWCKLVAGNWKHDAGVPPCRAGMEACVRVAHIIQAAASRRSDIMPGQAEHNATLLAPYFEHRTSLAYRTQCRPCW
jgi:hypothetical protein